jgi:ATP-dependent protease HslVU (ClpYQ) ATPase subunit
MNTVKITGEPLESLEPLDSAENIKYGNAFGEDLDTEDQFPKPQFVAPQFVAEDQSPKRKPKFIVLCGPTGVGKSMVPKNIFKLNKEDFIKIEIDSLVVQNKLYTNTIFTINQLDKNLIVNTINGKDKEKRKLLTDLFNVLYLNVKNNIIPCVKYDSDDSETQRYDPETQNLTCSKLHDYLLAKAINEGKTIVLEINGDKTFKWLFENVEDVEEIEEIDKTEPFRNKHRNIIREKYDTTIFYLSYNYKKLLESNKTRFLKDIKACGLQSCIARLGNFLLPDIYRKTINGIFTVHNDLLQFFKDNNITVRFCERNDGRKDDNNYNELKNFEEYKKSFELPKNEIDSQHQDNGVLMNIIQSPTAFSKRIGSIFRMGGRKTQKNKKQKAKLKKAKSKKQNSKSKKI